MDKPRGFRHAYPPYRFPRKSFTGNLSKSTRISRDFPSRLDSLSPMESLADEQLVEIFSNLRAKDLARISLVSQRFRRLAMQVKVIRNAGKSRMPIRNLISALPDALVVANVLHLASPDFEELATAEMDLLQLALLGKKADSVSEVNRLTCWNGKELRWENLPCRLVDKLNPFLGPNLTSLVLNVVHVRRHCLGTVRVITDLAMKCPLLENLDIHWSLLERERLEELRRPFLHFRVEEEHAGPSEIGRVFDVNLDDEWDCIADTPLTDGDGEEEEWVFGGHDVLGEADGDRLGERVRGVLDSEVESHGNVAVEGESVPEAMEGESGGDLLTESGHGTAEEETNEGSGMANLVSSTSLTAGECRGRDQEGEPEVHTRVGVELSVDNTGTFPLEALGSGTPMDIDSVHVRTPHSIQTLPLCSVPEGNEEMLEGKCSEPSENLTKDGENVEFRERLELLDGCAKDMDGEEKLQDMGSAETDIGNSLRDANVSAERMMEAGEGDVQDNDASEERMMEAGEGDVQDNDASEGRMMEAGEGDVQDLRFSALLEAARPNDGNSGDAVCSDAAEGCRGDVQGQENLECSDVAEGQGDVQGHDRQSLEGGRDGENMVEDARSPHPLSSDISSHPQPQPEDEVEETPDRGSEPPQESDSGEETESVDAEWVTAEEDNDMDDQRVHEEDPHTRLLAAGLLASRVALVLHNCPRLKTLKVEGLLFSGLFRGHEKLERLEGSFVFEFQNVVKVVNKMVSSFPSLKVLKLITRFHSLGNDDELVEPGAMLSMEGPSGCVLEELDVEGFRVPESLSLSFPNLARLRLHRGKTLRSYTQSRKVVLQCEKLVSLDLDIPISTESIESFGKTCPSLRAVTLRNCPQRVCFGYAWHSLEVLYLGGMGNPLTGAVYSFYLNCPRLKSVEIILGSFSMEELVVDCPLLKNLTVSNYGFDCVACNLHCPSLVNLSLGGIDPGSLEKIGLGCPNLLSLDVCCQKSYHVALRREFSKLTSATISGLGVCQTFQVACPVLRSLTVFYTWPKSSPPLVDIWGPRLTELDFKARSSGSEVAVPCRIRARLLLKLYLPFAVANIQQFGSTCQNLVSLHVKHVVDGRIVLDESFKCLRTLKVGEVEWKQDSCGVQFPPLTYIDIRCPALVYMICGSVGSTNRSSRTACRMQQRFCRLECPNLEFLDLGFYPLGVLDRIAMGCPNLQTLRMVGYLEEWCPVEQQVLTMQDLSVEAVKTLVSLSTGYQTREGLCEGNGQPQGSVPRELASGVQTRTNEGQGDVFSRIIRECLDTGGERRDKFGLEVGSQFKNLMYLTVKITGPGVLDGSKRYSDACECAECCCEDCVCESCGSASKKQRAAMERVGPWLGSEDGSESKRRPEVHAFLALTRMKWPSPNRELDRVLWNAGKALSDDEEIIGLKEESCAQKEESPRLWENPIDRNLCFDVDVRCPSLKTAVLCFTVGQVESVKIVCPDLTDFVLAHAYDEDVIYPSGSSRSDGQEDGSVREGTEKASETRACEDRDSQVRGGEGDRNRTGTENSGFAHGKLRKYFCLPYKMAGVRARHTEGALERGVRSGRDDVREEIMVNGERGAGGGRRDGGQSANHLSMPERQLKFYMDCPRLESFRWLNTGLDRCPLLVSNTCLSATDIRSISTAEVETPYIAPTVQAEPTDSIQMQSERSEKLVTLPVIQPSLSLGAGSYSLRDLELTRCCQTAYSLRPETAKGAQTGRLIFGPEWANLETLHMWDVAVDSVIISCPRLEKLSLSVAGGVACGEIIIRCPNLNNLYLDLGNGPHDRPCIPQILSFPVLTCLTVIGRLSEKKLLNLVVPMLSPHMERVHLVSRDVRNPRLFEMKMRGSRSVEARASKESGRSIILVSNWLSRDTTDPTDHLGEGQFSFD